MSSPIKHYRDLTKPLQPLVTKMPAPYILTKKTIVCGLSPSSSSLTAPHPVYLEQSTSPHFDSKSTATTQLSTTVSIQSKSTLKRKHSSNSFDDDKGGQPSTSKQHFHYKVNNTSATYKCSKCGDSYAHRSGLSKHMKRMHDNAVMLTMTCSECNAR